MILQLIDICFCFFFYYFIQKSKSSDSKGDIQPRFPNRFTPPLLRPIPTRPTLSPDIKIDIEPPTPEGDRPKSPSRPKNLIIPQLFVQRPSPTRERIPAKLLGSPPPQKSNTNDIQIFVTSESPEQETQKM